MDQEAEESSDSNSSSDSDSEDDDEEEGEEEGESVVPPSVITQPINLICIMDAVSIFTRTEPFVCP